MYMVNKDSNLVDYLREIGIAKNKIKTYVKLGFVSVNGCVVTKLPCTLNKGDKIDINKKEKLDVDINIIYEDDNYLVVDKEAGLLTISTGNGNKDNELFVLESCEYNKHFLSYYPKTLVVTNIELEHTECYKDLDTQSTEQAMRDGG